MDLEAIKSIFNNDDPARLFKLRFEAAHVEKGELVVFAPFQPQYARIKDIGDWHGGVMAAMLDVAGTFACALKAGRATPTMNLRIDYLKPPVRCDLYAKGKVLRLGRTSAVADVELYDAAGTVYALARGTWSTATAAPRNS